MRILHYYWTQFDDNEKPGGGVKVYLNNIMPMQAEENDVYMLSSGTDYDFSGHCRVKGLGVKNKIKKFTILNSPILAPSKCAFNSVEQYVNDTVLVNVVRMFMQEQGPFDVIHFHSLEGLSANVLKLKEEYPQAKFIMTLHNYFPFCPQVNLWQDDKVSCDDFEDGKKCVNCIEHLPNPKMVKLSYLLSYELRKVGMESKSVVLTKKAKEWYNSYKNILSVKAVNEDLPTDYSIMYNKFRKSNVELINQYIDEVICVSDRVKEIAVSMGVNLQKCVTLLIGTKFAQTQMLTPKNIPEDGTLCLIYMGYMRADKGFYFFKDALEQMPESLANRLKIKIAARFDDVEAVKQLKGISNKFISLEMFDGYTHETLHTIVKGVNVGVVPVLWEDNLPQVSMEMKAIGIPVLASDRGGASELSSSRYFKFTSGNVESFIERVNRIMDNPNLLNDYYHKQVKLKTLKEHNFELIQSIYNCNCKAGG